MAIWKAAEQLDPVECGYVERIFGYTAEEAIGRTRGTCRLRPAMNRSD